MEGFSQNDVKEEHEEVNEIYKQQSILSFFKGRSSKQSNVNNKLMKNNQQKFSEKETAAEKNESKLLDEEKVTTKVKDESVCENTSLVIKQSKCEKILEKSNDFVKREDHFEALDTKQCADPDEENVLEDECFTRQRRSRKKNKHIKSESSEALDFDDTEQKIRRKQKRKKKKKNKKRKEQSEDENDIQENSGQTTMIDVISSDENNYKYIADRSLSLGKNFEHLDNDKRSEKNKDIGTNVTSTCNDKTGLEVNNDLIDQDDKKLIISSLSNDSNCSKALTGSGKEESCQKNPTLKCKSHEDKTPSILVHNNAQKSREGMHASHVENNEFATGNIYTSTAAKPHCLKKLNIQQHSISKENAFIYSEATPFPRFSHILQTTIDEEQWYGNVDQASSFRVLKDKINAKDSFSCMLTSGFCRSLLNSKKKSSTNNTSPVKYRSISECVNTIQAENPDFLVFSIFQSYLKCQMNTLQQCVLKAEQAKANMKIIWGKQENIKSVIAVNSSPKKVPLTKEEPKVDIRKLFCKTMKKGDKTEKKNCETEKIKEVNGIIAKPEIISCEEKNVMKKMKKGKKKEDKFEAKNHDNHRVNSIVNECKPISIEASFSRRSKKQKVKQNIEDATSLLSGSKLRDTQMIATKNEQRRTLRKRETTKGRYEDNEVKEEKQNESSVIELTIPVADEEIEHNCFEQKVAEKYEKLCKKEKRSKKSKTTDKAGVPERISSFVGDEVDMKHLKTRKSKKKGKVRGNNSEIEEKEQSSLEIIENEEILYKDLSIDSSKKRKKKRKSKKAENVPSNIDESQGIDKYNSSKEEKDTTNNIDIRKMFVKSKKNTSSEENTKGCIIQSANQISYDVNNVSSVANIKLDSNKNVAKKNEEEFNNTVVLTVASSKNQDKKHQSGSILSFYKPINRESQTILKSAMNSVTDSVQDCKREVATNLCVQATKMSREKNDLEAPFGTIKNSDGDECSENKTEIIVEARNVIPVDSRYRSKRKRTLYSTSGVTLVENPELCSNRKSKKKKLNENQLNESTSSFNSGEINAEETVAFQNDKKEMLTKPKDESIKRVPPNGLGDSSCDSCECANVSNDRPVIAKTAANETTGTMEHCDHFEVKTTGMEAKQKNIAECTVDFHRQDSDSCDDDPVMKIHRKNMSVSYLPENNISLKNVNENLTLETQEEDKSVSTAGSVSSDNASVDVKKFPRIFDNKSLSTQVITKTSKTGDITKFSDLITEATTIEDTKSFGQSQSQVMNIRILDDTLGNEDLRGSKGSKRKRIKQPSDVIDVSDNLNRRRSQRVKEKEEKIKEKVNKCSSSNVSPEKKKRKCREKVPEISNDTQDAQESVIIVPNDTVVIHTSVPNSGDIVPNAIQATSETLVEEEPITEGILNTYLQWTDKYSPIKHDDIIGNGEAVGKLFSWLSCWKEKHNQFAHVMSINASKCLRSDSKYVDDADSDEDFHDSSEEEEDLLNTFIIIGKTGCGSTAAVYACAQELGYKVLELNPSIYRTGKHIQSLLGEATQSHQIKRKFHGSTADDADSVSDDLKGMKSLSSFFSGKSGHTENENNELKAKSNNGASQTADVMSVILLEQADVVFDDLDKGFWLGINELRSQTKRPIVITLNDPSVASQLDIIAEKAEMDYPTKEEAVVHLQVMCLAEHVFPSKDLLNRILITCHGDIRRSVMQLQFWLEHWKEPMCKIFDNDNIQLINYEKPSNSTKDIEHDCQNEKEDCVVNEGDDTALTHYESSKASLMQNELYNTTHINSHLPEKVNKTSNVTIERSCNDNADNEDTEQNSLSLHSYNVTGDNKYIEDVISSATDINIRHQCLVKNRKQLMINMLDADHVNVFQNEMCLIDIQKVDIQQAFRKRSGIESYYAPVQREKNSVNHGVTVTSDIDLIAASCDAVSHLDIYKRSEDLSQRHGWWSSKLKDGLVDSLPLDFADENSSILENWYTEMHSIYIRLKQSSLEKTGLKGLHETSELSTTLQHKKEITSLLESAEKCFPLTTLFDHRAIAMDAVPSLKLICKIEENRKLTQFKRRTRRFLHYLDGILVQMDSCLHEKLVSSCLA